MGKTWLMGFVGWATSLVLLSACTTAAPTPTRPTVGSATSGRVASAAVQPQVVASPIATAPRHSTATAARPMPPLSSAAPAPPRASPAVVLSSHTGPITALAWSPDSRTLASSARDPDHSVRLWSAEGALLATLTSHTQAVTRLAWAPDGQTLASGSQDTTVQLWSATGLPLATLSTAPDRVFSLAWSPDGQTLAVGTISFQSLATPRTPGQNPALPGIIRLWHPDGQLLTTLSTQYTGGKFLNLGWSPDGALLVAGAIDYRVWRADGTLVATLRDPSSPARGMAWSPDGRAFAVGDESGGVFLYSAVGAILATLRDNGSVSSLAFSPDGRTLAIVSSNAVQLLNAADPHADPLILYGGAQSNVAWSPDGRRLAVGVGDRTVRVWRTDGVLLAILDGCDDLTRVVAWSPDGQTVAADAKNQVCLWK